MVEEKIFVEKQIIKSINKFFLKKGAGLSGQGHPLEVQKKHTLPTHRD